MSTAQYTRGGEGSHLLALVPSLKVLAHIKQHDSVWITSGGALLDWYVAPMDV
jgi:hypothetical protein